MLPPSGEWFPLVCSLSLACRIAEVWLLPCVDRAGQVLNEQQAVTACGSFLTASPSLVPQCW